MISGITGNNQLYDALFEDIGSMSFRQGTENPFRLATFYVTNRTFNTESVAEVSIDQCTSKPTTNGVPYSDVY
jgi:hypothetical protein